MPQQIWLYLDFIGWLLFVCVYNNQSQPSYLYSQTVGPPHHPPS
jgi:hypothetical protein